MPTPKAPSVPPVPSGNATDRFNDLPLPTPAGNDEKVPVAFDGAHCFKAPLPEPPRPLVGTGALPPPSAPPARPPSNTTGAKTGALRLG